MRDGIRPLVAALLVAAPLHAQSGGDDPAPADGLTPVPDLSGGFRESPVLTGDWGGERQRWADRGITVGLDWFQAYQDIVDGGIREGGEWSTNLDYRLGLDLMRMGAVPGALVTVRGQSRFGSTVNEESGLLLPVNTYSAFPFPDGDDLTEDVELALTEFNWLQAVSDDFALLFGKVTTMATTNEFLGGEGRTQFMNFQFSASATAAQLAPYSTLAIGGLWMPNPEWTVTSLFMNLQEASQTSGFDEIGDGTTWATTIDYLGSLNELPGGGSIGLLYGFDGNFERLGGRNLAPGFELQPEREETAWAVSWSGWQYLTAEDPTVPVDTGNGVQDLEGLGAFAMLGFADENTNPARWSIALGLSGRGTFDGRDDDTWGVGWFYNEFQDAPLSPVPVDGSATGVELYYDFALAPSVSFGLNVQWVEGGFEPVDDATIVGGRLNVSL